MNIWWELRERPKTSPEATEITPKPQWAYLTWRMFLFLKWSFGIQTWTWHMSVRFKAKEHTAGVWHTVGTRLKCLEGRLIPGEHFKIPGPCPAEPWWWAQLNGQNVLIFSSRESFPAKQSAPEPLPDLGLHSWGSWGPHSSPPPPPPPGSLPWSPQWHLTWVLLLICQCLLGWLFHLGGSKSWHPN